MEDLQDILKSIVKFCDKKTRTGFIDLWDEEDYEKADYIYRGLECGMIDLKRRIREYEACVWTNPNSQQNTLQNILIEWRRLDRRVREETRRGKTKSRLPRNWEECQGFVDSFFGGESVSAR